MNFKELTEPLLSNYFLHSESQDSITVNQSNTFNLPFEEINNIEKFKLTILIILIQTIIN